MLPTRRILLLCMSVVCAYGCTPKFASPILHNDITYMAKPVMRDTVQWGTYVSGNITGTLGFNPEDGNTFCEINAYQSLYFPGGQYRTRRVRLPEKLLGES